MIASLVLFVIFSTNVFSQSYGINFYHVTWKEALDKARLENKLIFIDFYTQWCGPCLNMAETVFSLPIVGHYYNSTFINLKIDAENGEGVQLAKKFAVRSYPTYLFVDPNTGEAVHQSSSRQTAEQFIETGANAKIPEKRSFYLIDEYNRGNRDRTLLINYIYYNNSVYQNKKVSDAFEQLMKGGAKLNEPDIWKLFCDVVSGIDNPYIKEVSDNYQKFCAQYGKANVDAKLAKETTYGDIDTLDRMCDFEGKSFNKEMIIISNYIVKEKYNDAAALIDKMIINPQVDQQKLMARLKYIARLGKMSKTISDFWFNKCVEYLKYIAYNFKDRNDSSIHYEYATALEEVLLRASKTKEITPAAIKKPMAGKMEYSMRPDVLKHKPTSKI